MNVPTTPTTTTERAATQISLDETIKSALISPFSTGLIPIRRRVLRSSSFKNTNTCGSNNKISNDRRRKRKSAGATTTGSAVSTNAQCIVSDDDESILNKKKRKKDVTINFNTSTNTSNPAPTAFSTKNVGGNATISSVSSSSSSSPSSLNSQAQIHSKKYPFPHKLYDLMAKTDSRDVISWSADGTEFIVHDHARFASILLPIYFGHNQMRSFDRQLNYWEFERTNTNKISNKSFGGKSWKHPFFQKDRRDLLKEIVRKKIKNGPASTRRYTFNDGDDKKKNKKKNKDKNTAATKIKKEQRGMEEVLESVIPGPTHANVRKNMLLKIQSINRKGENLASMGLRRNIISPVVNQESSSLSLSSSSSSKESLPPLPELEIEIAPPIQLRRNTNLVVFQESSLLSTSSSSSLSSEEEESLQPLSEYVRTPSEMIATALYEDIEDEFLPLLHIDCFNDVDVDGDGDGDHKGDKNEDKHNMHNSSNNTDGGMVYQWDHNGIVFGGKSFHDVKSGGNDDNNRNENNDDDGDDDGDGDDDDDDDEAMSTLMSIILKDEEKSPLLTYKDDINEVYDYSVPCLFEAAINDSDDDIGDSESEREKKRDVLKKLTVPKLKDRLLEAGAKHSQFRSLRKSDLIELLIQMDQDKENEVDTSGHIDSEPSKPDSCLFLILDENLHRFPFEGMPILKGKTVCRVPCISFVLATLREFDADSKSESFPSVDPSSVSYVVDPENNLQATQKRILPTIESLSSSRNWNWDGVVGEIPPTSLFSQGLGRKNGLTMYFGHGGAQVCFSRRRVEELIDFRVSGLLDQSEFDTKSPCNASVLLMGCSSGRLVSINRKNSDTIEQTPLYYEPEGVALSYLCAGAPCVVGNLWDVTDNDIDR